MLRKLARLMPFGAAVLPVTTCSEQDLIRLVSALDEISGLADGFDEGSFPTMEDEDLFGFDEDELF